MNNSGWASNCWNWNCIFFIWKYSQFWQRRLNVLLYGISVAVVKDRQGINHSSPQSRFSPTGLTICICHCLVTGVYLDNPANPQFPRKKSTSLCHEDWYHSVRVHEQNPRLCTGNSCVLCLKVGVCARERESVHKWVRTSLHFSNGNAGKPLAVATGNGMRTYV